MIFSPAPAKTLYLKSASAALPFFKLHRMSSPLKYCSLPHLYQPNIVNVWEISICLIKHIRDESLCQEEFFET